MKTLTVSNLVIKVKFIIFILNPQKPIGIDFIDRRHWNKSNIDFDFELENGDVNETQKRYEDYLFNLHLNNQ